MPTDKSYTGSNNLRQGGSEWDVGGALNVNPGGVLNFEAGSAITGSPALPGATQGAMGNGGAPFSLQGDICKLVSAAGVGNGNDVTEDVLFSFTLPANSLSGDGMGLNIFAWGSFAANAHVKHARLRIGAADMVVDSGAFSTAALTAWALEATIFRQGANIQVGFGSPIVGTVHGGVVGLAGVELSGGPILIEVTGQTGTAAPGDIVANGLIVTAMP